MFCESDRRRRGWRAAALALLGAAVGSVGRAQPSEPTSGTFGERVEVEVVDVDVVVTDRKGNRITDLTQDDFELFVDGKPVPVEYFAAPRGGRAPADSGQQAPAATAEATAPARVAAEAPPSYLVVYVDQATLSRGIRKRAVAELREFVRRLRRDEVVAVAAYEQRLHLVAPPSRDPAAIERAFDELLALPMDGSSDAERRSIDARIRRMEIGWNRKPDEMRQLYEQDAIQIKADIERWADEELERQQRAIAGARQLLGAFAALEGRKSVVVATAGTSVEGAEALLSLLGAQLNQLGIGDELVRRAPMSLAAKQRVLEEFEAMVRVAQDARVALYAVYPPDESIGQNSAEVASAGRNVAMVMPRDPSVVDTAASVARMTGATGGAKFLIGRDLDRRLEAVRSDADSVYSLGFTTGPGAGDRDHEIEVRVRGDRLRARHRESFRRRTPAELAEQALYTAATLGEARDALGVTLEGFETVRVAESGGDRRLALAARVPLRGLALLPEDGVRRGRLSFRVALLGSHGELFLSQPQRVVIEVPEADLETALAGDWVHRADVRVTPSTRRLALLVIDEVAGVFATVTAAVAVGD